MKQEEPVSAIIPGTARSNLAVQGKNVQFPPGELRAAASSAASGNLSADEALWLAARLLLAVITSKAPVAGGTAEMDLHAIYALVDRLYTDAGMVPGELSAEARAAAAS
jgi:hypothetical protein